jgi:WD40 repeat protein
LEQRDRALTTESRFLADLARQAIEAGDPVAGALLAIEALPDASDGVSRPYVSEAELALSRGMEQRREIAVLAPPALSERAAYVFSGNGRLVVTLAPMLDGIARIWDGATGKPVAALGDGSDKITEVALASDGRFAVTGTESGTLGVWTAADGWRRTVSTTGTKKIEFVTISPGGQFVVSQVEDEEARLWTANRLTPVAALSSSSGHTLKFSGDGSRILGVTGGKVRLWNGTDGSQLISFGDAKEDFMDANFAGPDVLTTTGTDVRLWNGATGALIATVMDTGEQPSCVRLNKTSRWSQRPPWSPCRP